MPRTVTPRQTFNCVICSAPFKRNVTQIKNGATKCCSKKCLSVYFMGKGNPFWGRTHSEETKKTISQFHTGKNIGNKFASGYVHSKEARERMSEALRKRWATNRDKMLAALPKGWNNAAFKPPELRRYRKNFTPRQKREWKSDSCSYCGANTNLVLDHIIPVFDGGDNWFENCQTLCRECNLWKVHFIDLPRYKAHLARPEGP